SRGCPGRPARRSPRAGRRSTATRAMLERGASLFVRVLLVDFERLVRVALRVRAAPRLWCPGGAGARGGSAGARRGRAGLDGQGGCAEDDVEGDVLVVADHAGLGLQAGPFDVDAMQRPVARDLRVEGALD